MGIHHCHNDRYASVHSGQNWNELKKVGDWDGIVVMGFVEPLKTGRGHYLAMFHDDGRFFKSDEKKYFWIDPIDNDAENKV